MRGVLHSGGAPGKATNLLDEFSLNAGLDRVPGVGAIPSAL